MALIFEQKDHLWAWQLELISSHPELIIIDFGVDLYQNETLLISKFKKILTPF